MKQSLICLLFVVFTLGTSARGLKDRKEENAEGKTIIRGGSGREFLLPAYASSDILHFKRRIVSESFSNKHNFPLGKRRPGKQDESFAPREKYKRYFFSFMGGVFRPQMDFWNELYLPALGIDERFGANWQVGGNISYYPFKQLFVRLGAAHWSDKIDANIVEIEEIKISQNRFSVGVFYAPDFAKLPFEMQAYGGAEVYFYRVKNTVVKPDAWGKRSVQEQRGNDSSFAPVIGVERTFIDKLVAGMELGYQLGKYTQAEKVELRTHEVSAAGPQLMFSLGYRF